MKVLKSRKLIIALMTFIFIFSVSAIGLSFIKKAYANDNYNGGNGSKDLPYEIATVDQLKSISDALIYDSGNPKGNFSGKYFRLVADIDLKNIDWMPIGSRYNFSGNFDGNGHVIKNLNCKNYYAGLFGVVGVGGTIKNLGIESGNIKSGGSGGIVSENYGTIENCFNKATIQAGNSGGIAGINKGTLKNCFNTGAISGGFVGGIVGINESSSANCPGIIKNCYNVGSASGNPYVAGIVGHNKSVVSYCYSAAELGGKGVVSGITAFNEGTVENSFYNSDLFSGVSIGDDTDFGNCTTDKMTADDTLKINGAMELLQNQDSEGVDVWFKRQNDTESGDRYYPELWVFYNSSNLNIQEISKESVSVYHDTKIDPEFTKTGEYNYTYGDELNTKNDLLELEEASAAGVKVPGTFEFKFPNDKPLVSTTDVRIIFTPKDSNTYRVREFWLSITVAKAQITVPSGFTSSFTYDGTEKSLNIAENVNYTITGDKAINAGNYTVTFALKDSANYEWKDGSIDNKTAGWSIAKAVSSPTTINLSAKEGDVLSSITLPKGYSFKDAGTTSVGSAGNNIFKATYTTNGDTANYTTVEVDLTINVTAKDAQTNIEPPNDGLLIGMITGGIILACLGAVAMVVFISKRKQRLG